MKYWWSLSPISSRRNGSWTKLSKSMRTVVDIKYLLHLLPSKRRYHMRKQILIFLVETTIDALYPLVCMNCKKYNTLHIVKLKENNYYTKWNRNGTMYERRDVQSTLTATANLERLYLYPELVLFMYPWKFVVLTLWVRPSPIGTLLLKCGSRRSAMDRCVRSIK